MIRWEAMCISEHVYFNDQSIDCVLASMELDGTVLYIKYLFMSLTANSLFKDSKKGIHDMFSLVQCIKYKIKWLLKVENL